ncbi:hypothetical protein [Bacillus altitudinis]|uniref:hypothetical protein n=1 Tax=Bacillus altitudinis TaxID=293387 RepID=UPI002EAFF719|nr:hypothetical protein [Bacillus altitudinis]MEE3613490.1 hypothetical protein [Bacillus altitudinis]MEE3649104.1 hypothetical protein [Bacillus altitudinis]MEE4393525.1 hypothetical protein [Bacillus altitudinis]MEE4397242.1 hypothetical protein [Bacillus altitudinis]
MKKPILNVRTDKMTDEMYNHVVQRIDQTQSKTFREYAFELIQKDMMDKQKFLEDKEKDKHVLDLVHELQIEMKREFRDLRKKVDQKTFISSDSPHGHSNDSPPREIKEGILADEEVIGSIEEDYDVDF